MSSEMGLLILGSTDLTAAAAKRLLASGVRVAGLVSPPSQFRISYSTTAVQNSRFVDLRAWCKEVGVPFFDYENTKSILAAQNATGAAAALAVGWYHMVPRSVRDAFVRGVVGIHASLLPRYRGGAPLNWALLNGDHEGGVSLFGLEDGVDNGALYAQESFPIEANDYIGDLTRKVEALILEMLPRTIPQFLDGSLISRQQNGTPTYSLQRQPSDGSIDWSQPADYLARLVRAVSRPYPGAFGQLDGQKLIVWRARTVSDAPVVYGAPGQIVLLEELPLPSVVTGDGLLMLEEIEGEEGFCVNDLRRYHQRRFDSK